MASTDLGPLVRLRSLRPTDLPRHPDLAELQGGGSIIDPSTFAEEVLTEAKVFVTGYWPKHFKVKSSSKSSPPSTAQVELLTKEISADDLPDDVTLTTTTTESWVARSSIHENKRAAGTAEWSEFEGYLLDDHSKYEAEYTPDVYHAHKVLEWPTDQLQVTGWEKVEMQVYEMCHQLPAPLNPRTFSIVIVKGRIAGKDDFMTVQIPVRLSKVSQALYATGRNRTEGSSSQHKKPTTSGIYVSVERAELIENGSKVRWQMATASNAKGNLPMWAQKMGVPGAVVKDVGLFMDFVAKKRKDSRATN